MTTIQIYDPALCCSSGVCGEDADQRGHWNSPVYPSRGGHSFSGSVGKTTLAASAAVAHRGLSVHLILPSVRTALRRGAFT